MAAARAALAVAMCVWTLPLLARTLEVGEGHEYKQPSEAVAAAKDGDTIQIYPGQYFDCTIIGQNNLTIEGKGAGVIMTDKVCGGKAILITSGSNITIRNLTVQRARVPDQNGAGIRAEGTNLTVENSRFLDNEDGILSGGTAKGEIRILDSEFIGNGKCERGCAHGIYINNVTLLHVERSRFFQTKIGHHIKSRAARTEVINCDLEDGPEGTSSYLVEAPNGGSLIVEGNRMEKGPKTDNNKNAIMIGAEGITQPTRELIFKNNKFTNDQDRPTTFVHNLTATPAQLIGNVFKGQVTPLEGDGMVK
jgi:nitrous oxidase accessory protein NosD